MLQIISERCEFQKLMAHVWYMLGIRKTVEANKKAAGANFQRPSHGSGSAVGTRT
jgi:hypothetical protein